LGDLSVDAPVAELGGVEVSQIVGGGRSGRSAAGAFTRFDNCLIAQVL